MTGGILSEGFFPGGFLWLDFFGGDFVGGILSEGFYPVSTKTHVEMLYHDVILMCTP